MLQGSTILGGGRPKKSTKSPQEIDTDTIRKGWDRVRTSERAYQYLRTIHVLQGATKSQLAERLQPSEQDEKSSAAQTYIQWLRQANLVYCSTETEKIHNGKQSQSLYDVDASMLFDTWGAVWKAKVEGKPFADRVEEDYLPDSYERTDDILLNLASRIDDKAWEMVEKKTPFLVETYLAMHLEERKNANIKMMLTDTFLATLKELYRFLETPSATRDYKQPWFNAFYTSFITELVQRDIDTTPDTEPLEPEDLIRKIEEHWQQYTEKQRDKYDIRDPEGSVYNERFFPTKPFDEIQHFPPLQP